LTSRLASLARRKARNLGLLLVYALIVFLLASVMLFTHALRQAATPGSRRRAGSRSCSAWSPAATT
jgi:hypothetical protein